MGVSVDQQWQTDASGNLVMPEKQSEYLDWLLTPEGERTPPKEGQWCTLNGVAPDTVRKWRRDPRFKEMWERRATEQMVGPDRVKAVLDVLYNSAVGLNDVGAAKQYMVEAQKIMPRQEIKRDKSVEHLTDEELVHEIRMLLDGGIG